MIIKRLISFTTAFMMIFMLTAFLPSGMLSAGALTENPCNYQNNKEVPYDGSNWKQPREWNCPTIDPKQYQGGIMIYFDKIGLDPELSNGKVQRVYVSIVGATDPVSRIKFHIFYDTRLTAKKNSNDEFLTAGKALEGFTSGSAMAEEGQLTFYAYSDKDVLLNNGSLFTIDLIIPENAEEGDVYPIGMSYVDDGIAYDCFIDADHDDSGKLQMTYVFKKGIYNGYIKMIHFEPTPTYELGDVNGDGKIDIEDAVQVINHVNGVKALNADESERANVDGNSKVDIEDAVAIIAHVNGVKSIE